MEKIFLVSALDSLGVPYTPDNINMLAYSDIFYKTLIDNGYMVDYFNMSSLVFNTPSELIKILNKYYSISMYNNINRRLTERIIRNKEFNRDINPEFLNSYFKMFSSDYIITKKLIESDFPIFILSCGAMDLKKNLGLYTYDLKVFGPKILFSFNCLLDETLMRVYECLKYLLCLNSNILILMLGVYPLASNNIKKDLFLIPTMLYNRKLRSLCEYFDNVIYVDIYGVKNYMSLNDGHPTYEGHEYIASKLVKESKRNYIK